MFKKDLKTSTLLLFFFYYFVFQDNVLYSGGGDNHMYAWDLESGTCTVS